MFEENSIEFPDALTNRDAKIGSGDVRQGFAALKTAHESLAQTMASIKAEVKNAGEGGLSKSKVERMAADLQFAQQEITLLKQAQERAEKLNPSGNDGDFDRFFDADGKLRLNSHVDDDGIEWPGLLDAERCYTDWHRELLEAAENRKLTRMLRGGAKGTPRPTPRSDIKVIQLLMRAPHPIREAIAKGVDNGFDVAPQVRHRHEEWKKAGFKGLRQKAGFVDAASQGAEWIIPMSAPILEMNVYVTGGIEGVFDTIDLPMGTDELKLPYSDNNARPYLKGKPSSLPSSEFSMSGGTRTNVSATAPAMYVRDAYDDEASEDSILAVAPVIRDSIARALSDGYEDAIINGDTAAGHQDDLENWNPESRWNGNLAAGGTDDHRNAFIGLRARALDIGANASSDLSSAQTYAGLLSLRALLTGGRALTSAGLVWIMNTEWYITKVLAFDQTATIDKYGPSAAVIDGEVARLAGAPILLSSFLTHDMNTSGLYDNSTTTKSGVLCVSVNRFRRVTRRGITVETERSITRGMVDIVGTARKGFISYDGSSSVNVAYGYNLG